MLSDSLRTDIDAAHGDALWAAWVLATVLGVALATAVTFPLIGQGWPPLALNGLFGIALALPQWGVLRRYHPSASLWIVATVIGLAVAVEIEPPLRPVLQLADQRVQSYTLGVPGILGVFLFLLGPLISAIALSFVTALLQALVLTTRPTGVIAWTIVAPLRLWPLGIVLFGVSPINTLAGRLRFNLEEAVVYALLGGVVFTWLVRSGQLNGGLLFVARRQPRPS